MSSASHDAASSSSSAAAPRVPPGPPPRRGLLDDVSFFARFMRDPLGFIARRFAMYGDIYKTTTRTGPLFVVRHPDHIHEVLVSRASRFDKKHSAFERLSSVLGTGLLTNDGADWARHRRMVQPAFSKARMAGYAAIMADEARAERDRWRDGEQRDLGRDMTELTLRIVSRTLFSHDATSEAEGVRTAMASFHSLLSRPPLPRWLPYPGRARMQEGVKRLDDLLFGLIDERRRRNGQPAPAASDAHGEEPAAPDLLDLLVTATDAEGEGERARLSDREIKDELLTLFLAGHETTAHALTWTLIMLAKHPAEERKLHDELDAVLGDRAPTLDDLERLPFTLQAIKEAMRLYPPAYTLARRAAEDTEVGGYPVPRGSEVVVWLYMTHHDPRWFPEPERYRPERFTKEAEAALPRLAYLPFGAGARACIGRAFALIEAQLLLATLAQRYRLVIASGKPIVPKLRITMFPSAPVIVTVRRRGGPAA